MDKFAMRKRYFGHSAFRLGQERLIDAILDGRDVLGVIPAGRSVCPGAGTGEHNDVVGFQHEKE